MATPPTDGAQGLAQTVRITDDTLTVDLTDGRSISTPLSWYPRLAHGNAQERDNWQLVGQGESIRWPDLSEEISVANLLNGTRSGESLRAFKRWLEVRERVD